MAFEISSESISLENIKDLLDTGDKIQLHETARLKVVKCRQFLEEKIKKSDKPIYGVSTGFGSLVEKSISNEELSQLQVNLVLSHACGTGDEIPQEISRLMLLLKIINLSYGLSGIQLETLERLIFMYNEEITPVIYELGSLGASGDLAPLAHLSLPLLNRGEVYYKGKKQQSTVVFKSLGLDAIELGAKEGLALLNGTQFMAAFGLKMIMELDDLLDQSDIITSASLEAFDCLLDPFSEEIQKARPHDGQIETAKNILEILSDSEIANREKKYIQDPYSFRCVPQVHGASRDAIEYVKRVVLKEIMSVTDNPMVFPDEDKIISAGNFHGQPLALSYDFLAIAIAELASISERRIYKLISGQRDLPPFLTPNPGLNSGFMIPQYTAASIVSSNKQLCTPSSVDTIDSSNGQEDHVSMGANAAVKCFKVLKNYRRVLAIELLNASQALEFRKPLKSASLVEKYIGIFRKIVPFQEVDEEWHLLMKKAEDYIKRH